MAITVSPDPSEAPHRIQTLPKTADETPSDNIACARLTLSAPAKLNLFLHITGRRDDGYHLLQTVFQLLDYGDTLTMCYAGAAWGGIGTAGAEPPKTRKKARVVIRRPSDRGFRRW